MLKKLIIIGAGAHAKVILEAALQQGAYEVLGFCVDAKPIGERVFGEYAVVSDAQLNALSGDLNVHFVVAIGDNEARKRLFEIAKNKFTPATIIHPRAYVSPKSCVASGSVVLAGAVINTSASVGINSIVNLGVLVDHDSVIGDHVHLSPGTVVGSYASVPDFYLTALGQVIPVSP